MLRFVLILGLQVTSLALAIEDQNIPVEINPGFLGPNALPVPQLRETRVGSKMRASLGLESHYQRNRELVGNPRFAIFLPFSERAALRLSGEPLEYFVTSSDLQNERNALNKRGFAPGDLYFGAMFQILDRDYDPIDLSLNVTTKSTTGKGLESSRHTDAPGYIIDVTLADTDYTAGGIKYKLSSYIAFLAWQTGLGEQNDAFGNAIRIDYYLWPRAALSSELGYYIGTQFTEDRPVVIRVGYKYRFADWELVASYTRGINDAITNSLLLGFTFMKDYRQLFGALGLKAF